MNTRRIAFALATATAGILGVASVAWACVPGHDHGGGADSAGHSVDPALAPSLPVPTAVPAGAAIAAAPAAAGFDTASAPRADAEDGGSGSAVGFVVLAVGVALVLAAIVTGLRRSRGGAGREPVVD